VDRGAAPPPPHRRGGLRAGHLDADAADAYRPGIDVFKTASLSAIDQLPGCCSGSLLVNRAAGRAESSVTYNSFAAIEQTRDLAATIPAADTQDARAEVIEVAEFELALAHLRVPEMA